MTGTIFALSSPPGRGGVAVIRISGPRAWDALQALTPSAALPEPRRAALRTLRDPSGGDSLDSAVVIGFKAPASFTGEDSVELHCHGSSAVVEKLLAVLSGLKDCRLAAPGEFTRRAFENGKMDLTEAEAVADLINAETEAQRRQALAQMGGALSSLYNGWAESLKKSLAYAEAVIDFPDEDVPDEQIATVRPALETIHAALIAHLNDNRRGERLRGGIQVAVIGPPNAGKSSLVNALAQRDVAIVSDVAGTTRDVIEVHLDLGGYPVILSDTAGLRPDQVDSADGGHGGIESEGMRRALRKAEEADIRLLVFDGTKEELDSHTLRLINSQSLCVINKCDLFHVKHAGQLGDSALRISVQTGESVDTLLITLEKRIKALFDVARETPSLTRARHRAALENCRDCVAAALDRIGAGGLPELIAEDIRMAVRALGHITGRVDVEDVLDVIFRDFCIGK